MGCIRIRLLTGSGFRTYLRTAIFGPTDCFNKMVVNISNTLNSLDVKRLLKCCK